MMKRYLTLLLIFALPLCRISAEPLVLQSPSQQVSLLELYTSEGCSSCPPADRWLSTLKNDDRLWRQVVPLAFHVDYWDYIGWPDRFASPVYGDRQRRYAAQQSLSTVYTPGLILNGREWRGWFSYPDLELEPGREVGSLSVTIDGQQTAIVAFAPRTDLPQQLELHFAVLGFDLSSDVSAGENRGRTLEHDFVVLRYRRSTLTRSDNTYRGSIELPKTPSGIPRKALAAWVSLPNDPSPIQAVGGWF